MTEKTLGFTISKSYILKVTNNYKLVIDCNFVHQFRSKLSRKNDSWCDRIHRSPVRHWGPGTWDLRRELFLNRVLAPGGHTRRTAYRIGRSCNLFPAEDSLRRTKNNLNKEDIGLVTRGQFLKRSWRLRSANWARGQFFKAKLAPTRQNETCFTAV
jgi:hypothetical protein